MTAISIHALLAESDQAANGLAHAPPKFLSTLSLRRATFLRRRGWYRNSNFYPRSPCGERHGRLAVKRYRLNISIHALLAESDAPGRYDGNILVDFYPRSPCGERHVLVNTFSKIFEFLSTLSLRRATVAPVLAIGRA